MAEQQIKPPSSATLHVAPSPHFGTTGRSTRWMMYDVVLALLPAVGMSLYVFGGGALRVILISVASCLATEMVFQVVRRKPITTNDGSALVTGLILALSLPWTVPWWIPLIGGVVALAIGKKVFGGLGDNLFNPAMVGRAFVMICFTTEMTTWLVNGAGPANAVVDAATGATPLAAGKMEQISYAWHNMLIGNINGCLGETSALLLLLGGIYLCIRRTAAWQIPLGVLLGAAVVAFIQWGVNPETALSPGHHLLGGGMVFGAFFIATDPVSSPVTARGRWVFGLGLGVLTMLIRLFAGYPEGMMFAVLIMNSVTPTINRWTIPVPVGGKPKPAAG
jgi:electron transport complex protein RnfD